MKNKKLLATIIIFTIISGSLFYFVLEQIADQTEDIVELPLDSFSLTISDFPEGYIKSYENDTTQGEITGLIERYEAGFIKNTNESVSNSNINYISFTISKFESIDSAKSGYPLLIDTFITLNSTFLEDYYDTIGDESAVAYYEDMSIFIVFFRIKNILVVLVSQDDSGEFYVSSTLDYAKIIENRINAA